MSSALQETMNTLGRRIERDDERKEHDLAIARRVSALSVNEEGIIGRATPPLAALFGWVDKELDGKPMAMLVPERLRPAHETNLARYFKRPVSRRMGAGDGTPGTNRGLLSGWNEREQREFPVVIGLEPEYYLDQMWAIATLAQPVAAEESWQELTALLGEKLGIDLTGKTIAEAVRLAKEAMGK